jgi:AcrR family transcriptional regulator
MATQRPTSRNRILAAAADVARESGPGSLSLDAVAARAGVSKGGLLYNFPSKAALLRGLVEDHLAAFEAALEAATGDGDSLVAAYVRLSIRECEDVGTAAAWLFTAMAEDPDFMEPIRVYKRRLLDRLLAEAPDRTALLTLFLALEGLRSLTLFKLDILSDEERGAVLAALA